MLNRNILIIDDDHDLWQAYREVLSQQSGWKEGATQELTDLLGPERSNAATETVFDLQCAPQGREGFLLVQQAIADNQPFSVAFIDIRMPPGWDGMETARQIRAIDPNIEIVIVTAYSDRTRREIVQTVGAPDKLLFLRKPFDPEELYQLALSLSSKWTLVFQEKQLQAQSLQSQKLEAIGTLAGGIAHDLNNVLTPIIGYAQIGCAETKDNDSLQEYFTSIVQAGKRAAELIKQILTFSRRLPLTPQVVNLNDVINDLMKMLKRLLPEDIDLTLDLAEEIGRINVDVGQMEQILINLVVNARDAVDAHGRITVSTRKIITAGEEMDVEGQPVRGAYCLLEVSDDGHGMDEKVRQRIFDPFYTTKEPGKGTGLGLPTVYGAVKQHHGRLRLATSPGRGTTFSIYMPLAEHSGHIVQKDEAKKSVSGGDETILIAEDHADVRLMLVKALQGFGYRILQADSGDEALDTILQEKEKQIDLLLTDVIMPGLGGIALAERCRELHPEMPVIFMSGYSFDQDPTMHLDGIQTDFLSKPCDPGDVARTVRRLLDDRKFKHRVREKG